jgi:iron complex transport system substrate-binding protein
MTEYFPQRIACLQPSATLIVSQLGLAGQIVACTRHCAELCPEIAEHQPLVVEDSWSAQTSQILASHPDLVIAAVPYQLEAVGEILKAGIRFLGLAPHCLNDIYGDIATIGGMLGSISRADELIANLRTTIEGLASVTSGLPRHRVYCEEWGKPIIVSQPWVAELVKAAGGEFVGAPGQQITADTVRDSDPHVMVFAWCGAGDRVPMEKIVAERGWERTTAAREGRIYCIHDSLLTTPATNLAQAAEILASLIHPTKFRVDSPPRRIS